MCLQLFKQILNQLRYLRAWGKVAGHAAPIIDYLPNILGVFSCVENCLGCLFAVCCLGPIFQLDPLRVGSCLAALYPLRSLLFFLLVRQGCLGCHLVGR